MKNFDLNSYGVQEMDAKAMEEANGGFFQFVLAAIAGGLAYDAWKAGAKYHLTHDTGWHMQPK